MSLSCQLDPLYPKGKGMDPRRVINSFLLQVGVFFVITSLSRPYVRLFTSKSLCKNKWDWRLGAVNFYEDDFQQISSNFAMGAWDTFKNWTPIGGMPHIPQWHLYK